LHNNQLKGFLDAALRANLREDSLSMTGRLKTPFAK
jgi:hypothetical protein